MLEISATIARQTIDAVSTFEALEEAQEEAAHVRGGMYWHGGPAAAPDAKYLVRTTPAGAETSLGARTTETEAIYERFTQRKQESAERVSGLKADLEQHQRLNRALRVGRVDPLVVALLGRLASTHLSPHFRVVAPTRSMLMRPLPECGWTLTRWPPATWTCCGTPASASSSQHNLPR